MSKVLKTAHDVICMISRTDYDKLSQEEKDEINPFYDAFQDAVIESRMISTNNNTTIEVLLHNVYVQESDKLLWCGLHDLITPPGVAYIEFHNLDSDGNTINIEKYLIDSIVVSVVKSNVNHTPQTIKITGCVSANVDLIASSK